jgi:pimeloyl-ACP methyl ester carboxylesterase
MSHEIVLNAAGYQMVAVEYGDPNGKPMLALHGWLDNAATFYEMAKYLKGIKLIALDLIGHGRSEHRPKPMPYHIWDNVADIHGVLHALELDKVDLVGHSMGASIAMLFAATFPEKVNRLMLIEGLGPLAYEVDKLPELLSDAIVKRNRMSDKNLRPYKTWEAAVNARMNGRWPVSREAAEALLERGLTRTAKGYIWSNDPKLLMPSLVRFSPEQISSFLKSVKAEAIVIKATKGAADTIIDRWIDDLEKMELVEIEGDHHLHLVPEVAEKITGRLNAWV